MPHLRIAPEGLGRHLFIVPESGAPRAVDLDDLPIGEDLADRLEAWGDAFDATLDSDDTADPLWPSAEAEAYWRAEGALLAAALKVALGAEWTVESRF
ncbi:hypothetical protein [Prosthecomicrobium pneumaticum]|uniref:Uncharacterized protein n=1 Tax=Prosthecomicrobium pneumaticum TaxID=81895 RepID=A0A7W9CTS8_9HYPH|nr:hypothetical protein [Prosthecomicrobium pneumaticum]MBB5751509.1 hypothetical protein [Prosthecomicrobium pneumaticum]